MEKRAFLRALTSGLLGFSICRGKAFASFSSSDDGVSRAENVFSKMPQKIAFIVFNDITLLDLVGMYDPIARLRSMEYLPGLQWDLCAFEPDIQDNHGFSIRPDRVRPDLGEYDVLIVPGGFGTRPLQYDRPFIDWIKSGREAPFKVSVCTGALVLGAAGFLEGKTATTNPSEYENLGKYCGKVVRQEKVVQDGNIITGGAVSSSLDLGLYLCELWAGRKARQEIQQRMDYRCYGKKKT